MTGEGKFTLPESHAASIGRISDAWAQLEFQIDLGIWDLLETEQQLAACVTAQLSFIHPRIKAFISLVEVHGASKKIIKKLTSLYSDEISALSEKRNRSVHDPRMAKEPSKEIHRLEVTAKSKLSFGFKPEPIEKLITLHKEIVEVIVKFCALRDEALREIEALPEESRPQFVSIVQTQRAQ